MDNNEGISNERYQNTYEICNVKNEENYQDNPPGIEFYFKIINLLIDHVRVSFLFLNINIFFKDLKKMN